MVVFLAQEWWVLKFFVVVEEGILHKRVDYKLGWQLFQSQFEVTSVVEAKVGMARKVSMQDEFLNKLVSPYHYIQS